MTEPVKNELILTDVLIARVSLTKPFVGRTPQKDKDGKDKPGKYHVDAIFPQTHPQFPEVQTMLRNVAQAKWADKTTQNLEMIKANNQRFCLQRGDLYRAGKKEYAGMLYISAGNEEQPTLVATINGINVANRGTPKILTPADEKWPYAGSRCNVHLQFYCYEYGGSPGLGCSVLGVQFFAHGPRLSGSTVSSAGAFGIVPSAADGAPPAQQAPSGGDGLI